MSGYCYGETAPVVKCPCCDGEAHAEFCDIGVGYQQIEPYRCLECHAYQGDQGVWIESKENITGYYISPTGKVMPSTWRVGHQEIAHKMNISQVALRNEGWIRITNLEGYAISLPNNISMLAKQALFDTIGLIGDKWEMPYVSLTDGSGKELTGKQIKRLVNGLPINQNSSPQPLVENNSNMVCHRLNDTEVAKVFGM